MGQQPAGKLKGFLASLQLEIQMLGPHPTERTSGLKRISVWADLCQNGHCQLWKTAKENAEEHELVSYCLYRYIPGNSWFFCNYLSLIQHRKCGDTGIYFLFRLAHFGRLVVQRVLIPAGAQNTGGKQCGDIQHSELEPFRAQPNETELRQDS